MAAIPTLPHSQLSLFALSLSLSHSLSLSLSLSLRSVSFLYFSASLRLSLSLCLFISLSLCLSVPLSLSFSLRGGVVRVSEYSFIRLYSQSCVLRDDVWGEIRLRAEAGAGRNVTILLLSPCSFYFCLSVPLSVKAWMHLEYSPHTIRERERDVFYLYEPCRCRYDDVMPTTTQQIINKFNISALQLYRISQYSCML